MHVLRHRKSSLEIIVMLVFTLMPSLALFGILYYIFTHEVNLPTLFIQFVQAIAIIVQAIILFIQVIILLRQTEISSRQTEIMSRQLKYHITPIIGLKHFDTKHSEIIDREIKTFATAIINVKNLTDNPTFRIKLEEVNPKSGKKIDDEILKNIKCNIVEYLGPREEREMCYIDEPHKFAEVVDIVKISYLNAHGDWYEMVFRVEGKDKLIFMPIPQNVFEQKRKEMIEV